MLLTGEYINKVDDKGRLMVPARLRSAMTGSQVVATRGLDGCCIALFPPEYFDKTFSFAISGDDGMQIFSPAARMFTRRFLSSSQLLDFDSSGRVNLPQSLRSYAGIDLRSEVSILGMGNYIEIWNPARYDELMAASDMSISNLGQQLMREKRGQ